MSDRVYCVFESLYSPCNRPLSSFLQALKKGADFAWTDDCEQSFQELKLYLGRVLLLSKPIDSEILSLYLEISEAAVSAVLIRQEDSRELLVFYMS